MRVSCRFVGGAVARYRRLAVGAVSIPIAIITVAGSVPAADLGATDALMQRLMSMDEVPGAALTLIRDGGIVLERGYGFRDLATHAPVTPETLFNIGSISKSFTAVGIAQLVDRRQVDLDTPVTRVAVEHPLATQAVTLRQ